jgi:ATP-dependent Zn protease
MLKDQYKKVKALLEANKDAVAAIAEALLLKNELDEEEVRALVETA